MRRDSVFGDRVLLEGEAAFAGAPTWAKRLTVLAVVLAASLLAFAVALVLGTDEDPTACVVLAFLVVAAALGARQVATRLVSTSKFHVTDERVTVRRGPFRRSIDRVDITFARIRWSSREPHVGDLELVRAVPRGALSRTLSVTLPRVKHPDRVWAAIRNADTDPSFGDGRRPLAQRLDRGERVLWTAKPSRSPWDLRRIASASLAALLVTTALLLVVRMVVRSAQIMRLGGIDPWSIAFMVLGSVLGAAVFCTLAAGVAWLAIVAPGIRARDTRYFVTNRRVLVRAGREELSVARDRIACVVATPHGRLHNVFLFLDGPRARALAAGAAFAAGLDEPLVPVLVAVADAETVGALLESKPAANESLVDAA